MNKIYNILIEKIILQIGDFVLGTTFKKELEQWRKIQHLNEKELHELQQIKLKNILEHAHANIPYYTKVSKANNELNLKDFPILQKKDIKDNIDDLLWHPDTKEQLICEKSSGSSGIQSSVYMSKKEQSKVMALQTLMWEWAGYQIGTPMLQTGMSPKRSLTKKIKDFLFRVNYEPAFKLDANKIKQALEAFKGKPNSIFGGYASSVYLYALETQHQQVQNIKFKSVISWGDKMFKHYREIIEKNWGCKVYDIYGTTEGFVIAGQKDLDYHYIFTPQVYVELLNKDGNEVEDGQLGFVVVTHLDAYEMPLIRYYLGDMAIKLPKSEYPKHKELAFPLFKQIIGRDSDIVYTPKGNSLIVHSFTVIFEHITEIKQFRVIQNVLNSITIEYIADIGFKPEILENIKKRIYEELNEEIEILFKEVNYIETSPSGKPQLIISKLKPNISKWM